MDKIAQVTRKSAAPPGTVATAYKAILTALSACCLALAEYMFARCNDYAEDGAIGRVEQSNGSYLKIVYIKRYTVEEAQDPETLIEQLLSDEAPAPLGQWRQVVEVMTSDSPRKRHRLALPDFGFPRAMQSLVKSVHGVRYSLASEPMDTAAHGVVPQGLSGAF